MNTRHKACFIFAFLTVFYWEELFAGCPGALEIDASMLALIGSHADGTRAVAWQANELVEIPFDLVKLQSVGSGVSKSQEILSSQRFYVNYGGMGDPRQRIHYGDVLVFGKAIGGGAAPSGRLKNWARAEGCSRPVFWRVSIAGNESTLSAQHIYLVKCAQSGVGNKGEPSAAPPLISFDPRTLEVSGEYFNYSMSRKNQMLFDRLSLLGPSGTFQQMARDGAFDIRADFKNFLTSHFTAESVRSRVVKYHMGRSATFIQLDFGLKILFFDVDLDLRTDVLFTSDTVFLPMIMRLPRNAKRYVHPGSGVLYSWIPFSGVGVDFDGARMPIRQEFRKNFQTPGEIAAVIAEYCHRDGVCSFGADLVSRNNVSDPLRLEMEIRLPVTLVQKGFFPRLVADIRRESTDAGWRVKDKTANPEGIYFELSKLNAGEHGMDIWLHFDRTNQSRETMSCPSTLKARALAI